ncbi:MULTISPECIES: GNAT family N-acetyltransferase [Paracoccus]|uniref:GNAT family N-acetyltransferase n=1 Tax=Paracoccus litorisediminis TaxID=2006130 RepID=A0A844HMJ8_9RHOB|nr:MULTISPECIES: N-acetyltransferase [Paracoccus]MBD9526696.1 N-acetyltransferase [Paracoccus sp. PAR01]MTH59597.1 GNAT family N-acetyltransferase [Paracoccus litorisediminis]
MYELCPETPNDTPEVEALMDLCFAPGRTALSSYRLRDGVPPVEALCLVLRDGSGVLLGAIRYWPVRVGDKPALLLGPVSVHPTTQGEGLGGLLMRESLGRARELGWARVMLVGDLPYYRRFGFSKLERVEMPPPTNPDRVLGLDLVDGAWLGVEGHVSRETGGDVAAGLAEIRRDPPESQTCVEMDGSAKR